MATKKLPIWDQRMLTLMDYLIADTKSGIELKQDFFKAIKSNHQSALARIKNGERSFTHDQIYEASKRFNVSMEWFYGFTDKMKRNNKNDSVEELLQQALTRLKK